MYFNDLAINSGCLSPCLLIRFTCPKIPASGVFNSWDAFAINSFSRCIVRYCRPSKWLKDWATFRTSNGCCGTVKVCNRLLWGVIASISLSKLVNGRVHRRAKRWMMGRAMILIARLINSVTIKSQPVNLIKSSTLIATLTIRLWSIFCCRK